MKKFQQWTGGGPDKQWITPQGNVVLEESPPYVEHFDYPITVPFIQMQQAEASMLQDSVQQYDIATPLDHDSFVNELSVDPTGLSGTGCCTPIMAGLPEPYPLTLGAEAQLPLPQPVKSSTWYGVLGGSGLLVAGAFLIWWMSRKK